MRDVSSQVQGECLLISRRQSQGGMRILKKTHTHKILVVCLNSLIPEQVSPTDPSASLPGPANSPGIASLVSTSFASLKTKGSSFNSSPRHVSILCMYVFEY